MASTTCNNFEELLYTQRLADVDDKVRGKTIKKLKTFLKIKSSTTGFTYEDLMKIWKGLYYCMYMADKPLVQEDLAEDISNLIHHVTNSSQKLLFFKVALDTFSREWKGIDKFRMDKFLMLVTRTVRQLLIFLSTNSWKEDEVKEASSILEDSIICPFDKTNEKPLGLKIYIAEIILEELAKVGKETLPDKVLISMLFPFFKVLAVNNDNTYMLAVKNSILDAIIRQSELGLENQEDLSLREVEIVKSTESEDESEEEEMDYEENKENEFIMDPRAGGVDVHLPLLRPDYNKIAEALLTLTKLQEIPRKKRESLRKHARKFITLANGIYPFSFPFAKDVVPKNKLVNDAIISLEKLNSESSKKRELEDDPDKEVEESLPKKIKIEELKSRKRVKESKKMANIARMIMLKKKKRSRKRRGNKKGDPLKKAEAKQRIKVLIKNETVLASRLNELSKEIGRDEADSSKSVIQAKNVSSKNLKLKLEVKNNVADKNDSNVIQRKVKKLKRKGGPNSPVTKKANPQSDKVNQNEIKKKTNDISSTETKVVLNTENATNIKMKKKNIVRKDKTTNMKKNVLDEPLKEGEIEFEVSTKKYAKKLNEKPTLIMKNMIKKDKTTNVKKSILKNELDESFKEEEIEIKVPAKRCIKKLKEKPALTMKKNIIKKAKTTNVKKTEWDEPLKEGEIEFEVPSKKYAKKLNEKATLIMKKSPKVNKSGRTLKINLRKNQEHEYLDYKKAVASSPGIPFSALKKPPASVLKPSPSPNYVRNFCVSKINTLTKKYKL